MMTDTLIMTFYTSAPTSFYFVRKTKINIKWGKKHFILQGLKHILITVQVERAQIERYTVRCWMTQNTMTWDHPWSHGFVTKAKRG